MFSSCVLLVLARRSGLVRSSPALPGWPGVLFWKGKGPCVPRGGPGGGRSVYR